jgi:hypothetical protein
LRGVWLVPVSWQRLGSSPRVIRVMPNTPCLVGEAASALCAGKFATAADVEAVKQLLAVLGVVHAVTEPQMDGTWGREPGLGWRLLFDLHLLPPCRPTVWLLATLYFFFFL